MRGGGLTGSESILGARILLIDSRARELDGVARAERAVSTALEGTAATTACEHVHKVAAQHWGSAESVILEQSIDPDSAQQSATPAWKAGAAKAMTARKSSRTAAAPRQLRTPQSPPGRGHSVALRFPRGGRRSVALRLSSITPYALKLSFITPRHAESPSLRLADHSWATARDCLVDPGCNSKATRRSQLRRSTRQGAADGRRGFIGFACRSLQPGD